MDSVGRALVLAGLVIVALGLLLWVGGRLGLGHLPGDLSFERKGWSVHIPIVTCLVLSVVLTVLLNLFLPRR
ncbi:MAG: DUF2905 domain-containing protein [Myxococcales bacterium]|nr:DUF2905 domain-containing protein [Myxococcales bacterium]